MLRKLTRERREYLYRKSLEGKERLRYDQKRKIRKALEEGKPIPTELAASAEQLDKEIGLEDEQTSELRPVGFDSEYARAGIEDPRVFITTSREPSSRLTQFAKELQMVIPNAQKLNRGGHVIRELIESARANGASDLIIVHEHRGEPTGLVVSHLPFGPTVYFGLYNVVLRHDIAGADKAVPQSYPHLIFDNFTTPLGERISSVLKYLFPAMQEDSSAKRVAAFVNRDDFISFRHNSYTVSRHRRTAEDAQGDGEEESEGEEEEGEEGSEEGEGKRRQKTQVDLIELGPRFELRPYQVVLGTVENDAADVEWSLNSYTNTAKKRNVL